MLYETKESLYITNLTNENDKVLIKMPVVYEITRVNRLITLIRY